MGTLRDEMSRVLNEWDKQDQQPETTSQPSQEKTMEKRVTTTQKLINLIAANPGITSKALYKLVEEKHQDIPLGNVSSTLTQLTGRYVLAREASGEIVHGKTIYAYTSSPKNKAKRCVMRRIKNSRRHKLVWRKHAKSKQLSKPHVNNSTRCWQSESKSNPKNALA